MKKQPISGACHRIFNTTNLKMKFTLLFLFASLLQVSASVSYGQKNNLTIDVNNENLSSVFKIIENQSDFHFFYNRNELNFSQKIDLNVSKMNLVDVLNTLFDKTDISYEIYEQQIILKKQENSKKVDFTSVVEQKQIQGTVVDAVGLPMPGVAVVIEGTQFSTITDFDGKFSFNTDASGKTLVFAFFGYTTKRVAVTSEVNLKVVLKEEFNELDEVVLVGYGSQKRTDFSGSVSSISSKELIQNATGTIGFDKALGGLAKGVLVSQSTGRPGAPVRLNIRGITSPLSTTGGGLNQPLYVIDGVSFNLDNLQGANPLLTLNPTDIESLDILKDAGATSIYGSRGANGVIIIKTKRGNKNQ